MLKLLIYFWIISIIKTIYLRKGIGDTINENIIQKEEKITSPKNINNNEKKELYSYSQDITFPIKNEYLNVLDKNIFDNFDFASKKYEQSYETPYLPCGTIIKFQLVNNFCKGKKIENSTINPNTNGTHNFLIKNYSYISLSISKILDAKGKDLLFGKR